MQAVAVDRYGNLDYPFIQRKHKWIMESFCEAQRALRTKPTDSQAAKYALGLIAAESGTCMKNGTELDSKANGESEPSGVAPSVGNSPHLLATIPVEPPQTDKAESDERNPRFDLGEADDETRLMMLRGPASGEPLGEVSLRELEAALPEPIDPLLYSMPRWHAPNNTVLYQTMTHDMRPATERDASGVYHGPKLGRSVEWSRNEALWRAAGERESDGPSYVGPWMEQRPMKSKAQLLPGALPHHRVIPTNPKLKMCRYCGGDVTPRRHVKKCAREGDGLPDRCAECEDELTATTVLAGMLAPALGSHRKSEKKDRSALQEKARAVEPMRARISFEGERIQTVASASGHSVRGARWAAKRSKSTQINGTHGEHTGPDDVDNEMAAAAVLSHNFDTAIQMPAPSTVYRIGQEFILPDGETLTPIPKYDITTVNSGNCQLASAVLEVICGHLNNIRRVNKDAGVKCEGELYTYMTGLAQERTRLERLVRRHQNDAEAPAFDHGLPEDIVRAELAYAAANGLSGGGGEAPSRLSTPEWLDELIALIPAEIVRAPDPIVTEVLVEHAPPAPVMPTLPPVTRMPSAALTAASLAAHAEVNREVRGMIGEPTPSEATTVVEHHAFGPNMRLVHAGPPGDPGVRAQDVSEALSARPRYFLTPPASGIRSLAAVYEGQHVYRQAGNGLYITSGSSESVVVLARGHVPTARGYIQRYPGYYVRDDPPDDAITEEDVEAWLDNYVVALMPCAVIEHYPGFRLLENNGRVGFETDGGSFVCVPMIMQAMSERFASPSLTSNTFSSMIAWISRNYAGASGFPLDMLRGMVIGYFARVVGNVAAAQHPLVRGAIQLAAMQPTTGARNMDASEAYLEAVAMSATGQGCFTGYGHQMTTSHSRPVAWPIGYNFLGVWTLPGVAVPLPADTTRFTLIEIVGNGWSLAPGTTLQVVGHNLVPKNDLKLSYHTRFMAILPVKDERISIVLNSKDPGEMAQGCNNRLMKAVTDEERKIANSMNMVAYMLLLDPRIGTLVKRNMIRMCRHKTALCARLRESTANAAENLDFWQRSHRLGADPQEPKWDPEQTTPTPDQLEALCQIAAASALIYRMKRSERRAMYDGATVDFVGIVFGAAFTLVNGIMVSTAWHNPGRAALTVMYVALGVACILGTRLAVQYMYARLDASILHMVDTSGFAYRYLNGGMDWWYNMQSFVMQPHPKSRLYQAIVTGFHVAGIDWSKPEPKMVKGEVEIGGKPDEWCKFMKALRMIGACGGQIVFLIKVWTALKHWWSGEVDVPESLEQADFFFEVRPAKHIVCYNRPTNIPSLIAGEVTVALTLSDDGCCIVKEDGETEIVDDDRSNADNTMGFVQVGVIGATFELVGLGHLSKAGLADWIKPWVMHHPQDKASWVKYMPYHANMPSGTGGTTYAQNTHSVACTSGSWALYCYHRWAKIRAYGHAQTQRDPSIEAALDRGEVTSGAMLRDAVLTTAVALGGQSTCSVTTKIQSMTFLKRTVMLDTQDVCVDCAVLGVVLRGFGVVPGDVTREMIGVSSAHWKTLDAGAVGERYMRGVMAGWCHEPRSAFWDAMRERFPPSNLLKNLKKDEEFKLEERLRGANNTNHYIPVTQYIERYGGNEEEWISFCDAIRGIAPGVVLRHPVVDLILQVDYGVA